MHDMTKIMTCNKLSQESVCRSFLCAYHTDLSADPLALPRNRPSVSYLEAAGNVNVPLPPRPMAKLQNVKGCHWETVCVRMLCQNLDGRPHCCNPRNNQPRYMRTNVYSPWTQVFPDTYLACACLTPVSRQGTEAHHDDASVQETSLKAPEMPTVAPPGSRECFLGETSKRP
jgi:hypothetical protein